MAQWTRGKGYYNAHNHKLPLLWSGFHPAFCNRKERTERYITYLLSWLLHHKLWPKHLELHPDPVFQDAFLTRVTRRYKQEMTRREEESGPKKRSKAKR